MVFDILGRHQELSGPNPAPPRLFCGSGGGPTDLDGALTDGNNVHPKLHSGIVDTSMDGAGDKWGSTTFNQMNICPSEEMLLFDKKIIILFQRQSSE